jgi:DNA-binding NtrC family response regulator
MKDLLLIDDDAEMLQSLARALSPLIAPLTLSGAGNAEAAMQTLLAEHPKVVVLDLCLDERVGVESGFSLLESIVAQSPTTRVIILTGHGSLAHGVRALTKGAASFLEKPVDPAHLAALVVDAARQAELRRENERLRRQNLDSPLTQLVGTSDEIVRLREQIDFAASTNQPVLILGETGTGKGLCARLLHEGSARAKGKFVHYQPNFGGGDLVQSELFGHLKGAFTGAEGARKGLALEAHGGTLFIDELDEVPAETQVKLLDLIQERRVRALGSDTFQSLDCRFVAATNRPIATALEEGKIRRDLYHRIAHCVLELPPLRARLGDIPALCERILSDLQGREALNVFDIEKGAVEILQRQQWPGNVRELQAVVTNAAYQARYKGRSVIECGDVKSLSNIVEQDSDPGYAGGSFHEAVLAFKSKLVREALSRSGGNQVKAAAELGLDRKTLRRLAQIEE